MTDENIPSDRFVALPTSPEDKEAIVPGGNSFVVDDDTTKIVFNLKTDSTTSGTVTKINVVTDNVKTIEITMDTENGEWNPATTYDKTDMPLDLPSVPDVTRITITVTRENGEATMSVDVDVEACLKPG